MINCPITPSNYIIIEAAGFIANHEGLRLKTYNCPGKVKTIGYGHAIKSFEHFTEITAKQANDLLLADTTLALLGCLRNTKVPLNLNQQIALTAVVFTLGIRAYMASTLRQKLNRGEYFNASNEFNKWIYAGGKILNGLIKRRTQERELFLS